MKHKAPRMRGRDASNGLLLKESIMSKDTREPKRLQLGRKKKRHSMTGVWLYRIWKVLHDWLPRIFHAIADVKDATQENTRVLMAMRAEAASRQAVQVHRKQPGNSFQEFPQAQTSGTSAEDRIRAYFDKYPTQFNDKSRDLADRIGDVSHAYVSKVRRKLTAEQETQQ